MATGPLLKPGRPYLDFEGRRAAETKLRGRSPYLLQRLCPGLPGSVAQRVRGKMSKLRPAYSIASRERWIEEQVVACRLEHL